MSSRRRDARMMLFAQNDTISRPGVSLYYDTILAAVQIALFRCLFVGIECAASCGFTRYGHCSGLRYEFIERIYIELSIVVTDGERRNLSIPCESTVPLSYSDNFAYFAGQEAGCLCLRCPCP